MKPGGLYILAARSLAFASASLAMLARHSSWPTRRRGVANIFLMIAFAAAIAAGQASLCLWHQSKYSGEHVAANRRTHVIRASGVVPRAGPIENTHRHR
jgi:hypothetical protein